ncbi:hypothetical protein [Streptosporangium carneum]|uniref:Uncharacterized protein n=1 Tax=Streptosporangium carneum TaxID=47481 RepID=A0A9W6MHE8_9ACTN|nr:hypothetical protein [Streptosporangium carneum]GLK14171.1 hypothetical protein GCM10017600_75830 [Streptosporangium carneum]
MDPTTLTAIISALVGGVAGEAGKNAWTSLVTLARQRFGDGSGEVAALEEATEDTSEAIAGILVDRAAADPGFKESLESWASQAGGIVRQSHDVSNTIGGEARIHGTVIQAGDVFGSINLGPR